MANRARSRRIFLTAAAGSDASRARSLLKDAGFVVRSWDEVPPGSELPGLLPKSMLSCAGLIVFVSAAGIPDAALVEAGAFLALDKPVILLLESRRLRTEVPIVLDALPVVVIGDDRRATTSRISETIEIALSRTAAKTPPIHASAPPSKGALQVVSSPHSTDFGTEAGAPSLGADHKRAWSDDSERRVAEAFLKLGADVVGQHPDNDRRQVDMAVWVSGLPNAWNPLLVDVAGRLPNVDARVEMLRNYLASHHAALGILVVPEAGQLEWRTANESAILILDVKQLQELAPSGLLRLVQDGRNRLAHAL